MHLEAFLVPEAQFDRAMNAISRRNFFGKWMRGSAKWLHVFVGEYPWASACNVETDDWLGFGTRVDGSSLEFMPVYNEVLCQWGCGEQLCRPICIFMSQHRAFFEAGPLWWNGVDGFSTPDGKIIFRDPSTLEGGTTTLLADKAIYSCD